MAWTSVATSSVPAVLLLIWACALVVALIICRKTKDLKLAIEGSPSNGKLLSVKALAARAQGQVRLHHGYLGHVVLRPRDKSSASGKVTFAVTAGALRISAVVDHAVPGDYTLTLSPDDSPHGFLTATATDDPQPTKAQAQPLRRLGTVAVGSNGHGELTLYLHPAAYPRERVSGWQGLLGRTVTMGSGALTGVVIRKEASLTV